MKKTHLLFTTLAAIASIGVFSLMGCSGDDSTGEQGTDSGTPTDSGGGGDSSKADSGNPNAPPTLGAEIDREGRPTVNTALNHSFDINAATKGAAKDAYNQDQGVAGWPAAYAPQFEANLAVLDSLSTTTAPGDGCGSQLGYGSGSGGYSTLAGALADDRLYVNTAGATCAAFLAVEANALAVLPNNDCGGRRPNDDVINTIYSVVAAGQISGVSDGVDAPSSPASTTFPYLAAPH